MAPVIAWIKDGVLLDRMPENALALALASMDELERVVDCAFRYSGLPPEEKLRRYNAEGNAIALPSTVARYRELLALVRAEPFPGVLEVLEGLCARGVGSYITTTTPQEGLDAWLAASSLREYLAGALGYLPGREKGDGHYAFLRGISDDLYAVADAQVEIGDAARNGVVPIGFAHVITPQRMELAAARFSSALGRPVPLDASRLHLPGTIELERRLREAGARHVVSGETHDIMPRLAGLLNGILR